MTKNKPAYDPPPTEKLIQKVQTHFTEYCGTLDAIHEDYIVGNDGMFTEVEAAKENFTAALEELAQEEPDYEFLGKQVAEALRMGDIESDVILPSIDEDEIFDHLNGKGYLFIKVDSLDMQQKLEAFVKTEIYPHVNQSGQYSFL